MNSRNNSLILKRREIESNLSNIPVECLRKTRSLNINSKSSVLSGEVYKILKSNNGRKIFT
ncbi:MAG: hypothetical protein WC569_04165 [Candidatus Omnitrophota bacterium]